jgi:hypothetical protein
MDASPPDPGVSTRTGSSASAVITEGRRLVQLLTNIRQQFAARRHSALLAVIIAAYAVKAVDWRRGAGLIVFGAALLILLFLAL